MHGFYQTNHTWDNFQLDARVISFSCFGCSYYCLILRDFFFLQLKLQILSELNFLKKCEMEKDQINMETLS